MKIITAVAFVSLLALPVSAQAQQANGVFIDQIGDNAKVTISQEGKRNIIGETAPLRAVLGGTNGVASIIQTGDDNAVSRNVKVNGSGNQLTVLHKGDRNRYSSGRTVGNDNVIALYQTGSGNDGMTSINGQANRLSILQEGRDNVASLSATGSDNRLSSFSKGEGNRVNLISTGSGNVLSANQLGAGNTAVVRQTGNGASLSIIQR